MDQITYTFNPLPKQLELLNATQKEVLFSGGLGAAKSYALALAAIKHATIPNNTVLLAKKTLKSLKQTTYKDVLSLLPPNTYKHYKAENKIVMNGSNSEIIAVGLDDLMNIRSMNLGCVIIDEASQITSEDDYTELLYRLRLKNTKRQLYAATNPATPSHFLYKRFFADNDPSKNSRKVIITSSLDNPYLPKDYIDNLLDLKRTDEKKYKRLVLGQWLALDAAVYDNFDRSLHVKKLSIDNKTYNYDRIIIGVDYGYTDPTVMIVVGVYGGLFYVLEEIYKKKCLLNDIKTYAKELKEKYPIAEFVCDPSAALIIAELQNIGLSVSKANNDIKLGIGVVRSKLANNNANIPSLYIDDSCVNLIREFENYTYKPNSEVPEGGEDHCLDSLRYSLYTDTVSNCGSTVSLDNIFL